MTTPTRNTLIQISFVDLKNRPFKNLYHEVRKSGEHYALSAGNSDAQGLGVWIKQPAGTHLDIVVRHPISKKMIPAHQYIIVPDKKGKIRIQAPFYIEEKVQLQESKGSQGDYRRKTHKIKEGETLTHIAKQYGTDWQILFQLNKDKIRDPDEITIGQVIKIPARSGNPKAEVSNRSTANNIYNDQQLTVTNQSNHPITNNSVSSTNHPTVNNYSTSPHSPQHPIKNPHAESKHSQLTSESESLENKINGLWNSTKNTIESGVEWTDKQTQPMQDAIINRVTEIKEGIENAVSNNSVKTTNIQKRGQNKTPKIISTTNSTCVCKDYSLIWSGHSNVTCEFRKKVVEICKDLWPEKYLEMANNLMALMHVETAGTFSPKIDNHKAKDKDGYGYVGLIQFGNDAVEDLNKYCGKISKKQLVQMSAVEQLDWVKKYFKLHNRYKKIHSFVEMYLIILYPAKVNGAELKDNDIVFRDNGKIKGNPYMSNKLYMKEPGEFKAGGFNGGVTYVKEIKHEIDKHFNDGQKPGNKNFQPKCGVLSTPAVIQHTNGGVLDEMKKIVDLHIPYSQLGERGSLSSQGMKNLDCSETVAIYLNKLGIMSMKAISTHTMTTENAFQKTIGSKNIIHVPGSKSPDFKPQRGDIFVWRRPDAGHTGIVYNYDERNDTVTILEAIGKVASADEKFNINNGGYPKAGCSRTAIYKRTGKALASHGGWCGYFRPINYNRSL